MEGIVLDVCRVCGKTIEAAAAKFRIGESVLCENCAETTTIVHLFNTEKISEISMFVGKNWWNPFEDPKHEGDADVEDTGYVTLVVPYQRYCEILEKISNPNKMSDEKYPELLSEENFNQLVKARDYAAILRTIYGEDVDPASERGAETILHILPELESNDG